MLVKADVEKVLLERPEIKEIFSLISQLPEKEQKNATRFITTYLEGVKERWQHGQH